MAREKKPKEHENCVKCGAKIPEERRSDAKYCTQSCRAAAEKKRYKDRNPEYVERQNKLVQEIRHKSLYGHTDFLENPIGNKKDKYRHARALGYRSGLEVSVARDLEEKGVPFTYEKHKIKWEDHKIRTYTPDVVLGNGIIIETKGYFTSVDRVKHLTIKKQYPNLDIRFVFTNPNSRLNKRSKTTYGMWCEQHGFQYAAKTIPEEWLLEEPKEDYEMEGLL